MPRPGQARRKRRQEGRIADQAARPTLREKKKARKAKRKKKATGGPAVTKVKLPTGITHTGTGKFLGTPIKPKPKPKKERGYGQAQEGRGGYSHGGSVSSRLSKAGPKASPN